MLLIPFGEDDSLAVEPLALLLQQHHRKPMTAVYTTGSPTTIDYNTYPTAGVPVNGSDMNYVNNKYYYDISRAGSVDATNHYGIQWAQYSNTFSVIITVYGTLGRKIVHWDQLTTLIYHRIKHIQFSFFL